MSESAATSSQTGAAGGYETLAGLIGDLAEPAMPPPVPLIPQTWGWAVLAALVLAGLAWAVWLGYRHRKANAYRRAALAELAGTQSAADMAVLLRRTALAAYPRAQVAGLTGRDWLGFLGQSGGQAFPEAAGAELLSAPYRPGQATASAELRAAVRHWVSHHQVEGTHR